MKYRNIYNRCDFSPSAGLLFGPVGISKQYELIKTKKSVYCIRSINDDNQELSYFDVDENQLYTDIIYYGSKLYDILKDDLLSVDISKLSSRKPSDIIYDNGIAKHIDLIEPICIDFIDNYGFPLSTDDEQVIQHGLFYYLNKNCYNIVSVVSIVRYILIIFMLHQSLIHLNNIKNVYPQIYSCLFNNPEITNSNMLNSLSIYANSYNNFLNQTSKYVIRIITRDDNTLVPIRYTTNLFTFAFEVFINCLCTLSYKAWENDDTYSYISFRKCQKCLKNIFDEPNVSTTNNKIPLNRFYICDDCKKDAKRIASRKYEHSLREMYDDIKSMLPSITNPELIATINSMKPKDIITKKELKELKDKILKENGRN